MAETDREGAKAIKTRILHEGRPEVERAVPVIGAPTQPQTFTSRRGKRALADKLVPSGLLPPEGPNL
jgi:hypothetical protein